MLDYASLCKLSRKYIETSAGIRFVLTFGNGRLLDKKVKVRSYKSLINVTMPFDVRTQNIDFDKCHKN